MADVAGRSGFVVLCRVNTDRGAEVRMVAVEVLIEESGCHYGYVRRFYAYV